MPANEMYESHEESKYSFCHRLKKDGEYRRKLQLTSAVCCSYIVLGCIVVQIGTALPDLQTLVRVDLETVSWLFTAWSIGYIIGSLISGVIFDRWNRLKYMGVCTVGSAIASTLLPWLPSFPVMLASRVATGWFCGAIDTGANTIVPSIWGNKAGRYMQVLYLSYTLGGIICPLLTRPFMTADLSGILLSGQENAKVLTTSDDTVNNFTVMYNVTHNELNISAEEISGTETESLRIHFAFVFTGVATLLTAFPYFIMSYLGDYDVRADEDSFDSGLPKAKISQCRVAFIILFVCMVNILYAAAEDSIGAFLVTFSLNQLRWNKTKSVILLALYWGTSCLGGVIGVFVIRRLGLAKMTFLAYLLWMISFLGALLCSQFEFHYLIWFFIPLSGMCMVVIIPNVISWTEAYVRSVSGKISSLIMMSTGIGIASNPPFIGHLMEKYSLMCFLYVLFIEAIICTLCFSLAYTILHCCHAEKSSSGRVETELEETEKVRTPMFNNQHEGPREELTESHVLLSTRDKHENHEGMPGCLQKDSTA